LNPLTADSWLPLLSAARNGDMQQTEYVFEVLKSILPLAHKKAIQGAITQFDLGLVEELVVQYQKLE